MGYGNAYDPNDPRFRQGYAAGQQQAAQQYDLGLQQAVAQMRQEFDQKLNRTAGGVRKEAADRINREAERLDQRLSDMAEIAKALTATRSGGVEPGTVYVDDIPGRRIPYVALVEIPIQANDTSTREQSWRVTQEGLFVAERRWATFLSNYEYQVTNSETGDVAKFAGRSFGRYRPPHSASDYVDSQHSALSNSIDWLLTFTSAGLIFPGATPALTSTASSFRTMEFDGRIEMREAGSEFPRQNRPMPSAWWANETNGPVHLSALDVFERGQILTFKVQPNHVNNPPAGNAAGACVLPNADTPGYPFVEGQFDPHEGVCTPDSMEAGTEDADFIPLATDPIQRLPSGFLILGLEGYRVGQPPGVPR